MFKMFKTTGLKANAGAKEEIYLVTTTLYVMPPDIHQTLLNLAKKEGLECEAGPFGSVLFMATEKGATKLAASYQKWLNEGKEYFAILIYNEQGCVGILTPEM